MLTPGEKLFMQPTLRTSPGFTLIEMLVVMPLVIILVGGLVAVIVQTTGTALRAQAKTQLQLDVLDALDRIEQDVRVSASTTGIGDTTTSGQLALTNFATSKNPYDSTRSLIQRVGCSISAGGLPVADALTYQTLYAVSGSTFTRSVTLSDCATSNNVWQKNNTETLIKDATTSLSVSLSTADTTNDTVQVTLSSSRDIAGQTVSYTGKMYVRSLNMR